jgi:hypothetical protein
LSQQGTLHWICSKQQQQQTLPLLLLLPQRLL